MKDPYALFQENDARTSHANPSNSIM